MAAELFNSQGGYSVGIPPIQVIDSNANVTTNVNAPNANITANVFYANVYKFANGVPVPIVPVGSNTEIIFNDEGAYAGDPRLTYDKATSILTLNGNLLAGDMVATSLLVNFDVTTDQIVGRTGGITIAPTANGNIDVSNAKITSLADPENDNDATNKRYVDAVASGLTILDACFVATPDSLATLSGGNVTYNNGSLGVGANLVLENALNTIDGQAMTNGDRVLVKSETNSAYNGIYTWATGGTVLTRSLDFDTTVQMQSGSFTFVTNGVQFAATGWVEKNDVAIVGTSPVEWQQFSGAPGYTAGTGLTLTGTTFSISNTTVTSGSYGNATHAPSFTVNPQGQLTLVAPIQITPAASVLTGTTLSSNVMTSSLTSVGVLTHLNVSGNTVSANIIGNHYGNGIGLSNIVAANVVGNVANAIHAISADTATHASTANTVTDNVQPNITSVGTLVELTVAGNVSADYFLGDGSQLSNVGEPAKIYNGTSNVTVAPSSNVTFDIAGSANVLTVTSTGLELADGNIVGANYVSATTFAGNLIGNFSGSIVAPGNAGEVVFNKAGLLATSSNLVFTDANGTLDTKQLLIANSFQLGSGIYQVSTTTAFGAITDSATAELSLWEISANVVSAVDFLIISTDTGTGEGNNKYRRQRSNVSSTVLGTSVAYTEIGKIDINGATGNYAVLYNPANNSVELAFTSFVGANHVQHNIQITSYYYV